MQFTKPHLIELVTNETNYTPKAPRGVCAEGLSSSSLESSLGGGQTHEESWKGARPSPEIFLLFDLNKERSDAVFKLDLTEETRTQLQEEEAVASSCLILATSMTET